MSSDADRVPTLRTILDKLNEFRVAVEQCFDSVERRLSVIERLVENMDMRLDGIESFNHQTRSEVLALRKEFKEFRSQFNQPA
jgi:septation ring formation regulator EzrA